MSGITLNEGTQSNIATDKIGSVNYQVIKLDVGAAGASSPFTGTLKELTNIVGGTVTKVNGGSIVVTTGTVVFSSGTIAAGTVQPYGLRHANYFATIINTTSNNFGTIKPAVAGSAIYVTDMIISVGSATNLEIDSGTTTTPIFGSLYFNAQGGMIANFTNPPSTASGSALTYKQSTSGGPLSITVMGYVQ